MVCIVHVKAILKTYNASYLVANILNCQNEIKYNWNNIHLPVY